MHKDQSRIAAIELISHSFWEILFKPNVVLSLEDVVYAYQFIHSKALTKGILMDWSMIQGIEFEALEYIARTQNQDHPLAIVSETGSIGEKYSHLIDQLCEQNCSCINFTSMSDARNWLTHYAQKEA